MCEERSCPWHTCTTKFVCYCSRLSVSLCAQIKFAQYTHFMEQYLCGRKALEYWGILETCKILSLPEKEEYVVFSKRDCYRPSGVHWCQFTSAKRYTENDVCTLPYLFLRYAHELSLLKLIFLGLQICACPTGQVPQCTVRRLKDCALSLKGHQGRRKALQALQYIQNKSCSPMESKLYMHLCLPNSLGGCGFPQAMLNHPIRVGSNQFYLDLYFPTVRLGVEYDSYEYHNNARSFSQDNFRDAKLRTAGYQLVHVKPGQLQRIEAFQDLAVNLSRLLRKPIYIRTEKFLENFKELFYLFKPSRNGPAWLSDLPKFGGVPQAYDQYQNRAGKILLP